MQVNLAQLITQFTELRKFIRVKNCAILWIIQDSFAQFRVLRKNRDRATLSYTHKSKKTDSLTCCSIHCATWILFELNCLVLSNCVTASKGIYPLCSNDNRCVGGTDIANLTSLSWEYNFCVNIVFLSGLKTFTQKINEKSFSPYPSIAERLNSWLLARREVLFW